MGVAYFRLGKYQKEIEAYKKAIEIKPDSHEAYDNMGAAYT
jgi:tetratricopeptide (TPR) repeat protein